MNDFNSGLRRGAGGGEYADIILNQYLILIPAFILLVTI